MRNKGIISGIYKALLFIIVAYIGFLTFQQAVKVPPDSISIPIFGSPTLFLWVLFIVLIISFGYALKERKIE